MVLLQNEQQTTTQEINNKVWLNIEELSKYADMAVGTISNYVSNGDIPHTKEPVEQGLKNSKIIFLSFIDPG
jgi:hypothetical protein